MRKLNNGNTESLLVGFRRRGTVSQDNHLKVGSHISFKSHIKTLGVSNTDGTLSVAKHTDHISRSTYFEIRRISSIHHLRTRIAIANLICSFVLKTFHWLPVRERVIFKIATFALPFLDGTLPPCLNSPCLSVYAPSGILRSSSTIQLKTHTHTQKNLFLAQGGNSAAFVIDCCLFR